MRDHGALGIAVRLATGADDHAIAELWIAADAARWAAMGVERVVPVDVVERTRRRLGADGSVAVVALDGEELVAVAVAVPALANDGAGPDRVPGLAHVTQVAVRPERWGGGLGALVVERLVEEVRRLGYRRGQLWTHASNTRAQGLYARLGWAASGRSTVDERGEPIRHYQLEL